MDALLEMRAGAQPIEIELDKPRSLLLEVYGLKRAERELNKSREYQPRKSIWRIVMEEMKMASEEGGSFGMDFSEAILWAALVYKDPSLTLDEVGRLPWNQRKINDLVFRLINETWLSIPNISTNNDEIADSDEKKNLMKLNGTAISGPSPESS